MAVRTDGPRRVADRVYDYLLEKITSGEWQKNHKLRAEPDLAAELGVSRGSLRKAIGRLIDQGLLAQVHGRGTFVMGTTSSPPLAERLITFAEFLRSTGKEWRIEQLSRDFIEATEREVQLLGVPLGSQLLSVRRLAHLDGAPYAVFHNVVNLELSQALEQSDFSAVSLFSEFEHIGHRVAWGRRTFDAVVDAAAAKKLEVAAQSPLLHIEQVTYDSDDVALEYSDIWYNSAVAGMTVMVRR